MTQRYRHEHAAELDALREGARRLGAKPGAVPPPLRKLPVLPVVEAIARTERAAWLWLGRDLWGRVRDGMFRHTHRLVRRLLRLERLRGEVEAFNRRVETKQAVLESPELRGVLAGVLEPRAKRQAAPSGGSSATTRKARTPDGARPRLPELARTPFRSHELWVRGPADAGYGIAWLEPRLRATFRLADGTDRSSPSAPAPAPSRTRPLRPSRSGASRHPARIPVWRCELRGDTTRRRRAPSGRQPWPGPRKWSRQEPAVRPFRDRSGDWKVQARWEPP